MGCCSTEEKKEGACCSTEKKGCCGMKMCKNVGTLDRLLRVGIGAVLVTLTVTGDIGVWGWLGVLLIGSGLIGFCGGYTLLGMNTTCCSKQKGCCDDKGGKANGSSCCGGSSTPPTT